MYRYKWIVIIMLLMVLGACRNNEVKPDDNLNQEVDMKEPVSDMPEGQLANPPTIYVVSGAQRMRAVQGTTSWYIDLGNGKGEGYEADSDDPMGLVKFQEASMIVKPGDEVKIEFAILRSSIIKEWTDAGPGDIVFLTDQGFIVPPGASSRVYEIVVHYDQGTVYYAFELTIEEEDGSNNLIYPSTEAMHNLEEAYNEDPYYYAKETEVYQEVVSLGEGTIELCREALKALGMDNPNPQSKQFYEWVISETIRYNFPEELYAGREIYFETTVNAYCKTYTKIGEEERIWSDLRKDTLIQITEMLNIDYFIGHRIGEAFAEDQSGIDTVRFIIKREDLTDPYDKEVMGYQLPRLSYLNEFNLVAVSDEDPVTDHTGRHHVEIPVYDQPNDSGTFIGYVYAGDLLKYATTDSGRPIQRGEWSLVDIIPYNWCINSNSAWIQNVHLDDVTPETVANAGFVMAGTKLYLEPDPSSIALDSTETDDLNFLDPFRFGDVYCVRVLGEEGDFYRISDEINGLVGGYVLKEDLFFYVDPQLVERLEAREPDMEMFVEKVKNQILTKMIQLTANDQSMTYTLTKEQKENLANSLKTIDAWEGFDGGIRPYREAAYPYISLDLGDAELIVAENGRLLITIGQREAYYYGIGTRGMPIRFMTPNSDFIHQLIGLVAVPDNVDPEDIIYLLNANQVEILQGDSEEGSFYDSQVHINHAVRGLINVFGKPIDASDRQGSKDKYRFRFTMPDHTIIEVVYEGDRILFNGQWYQASKDVYETVSNMFAAYF